MRMNNTDLRPAVLAGQWYRADPEQLRVEINHYLSSATPLPEFSGQVIGLLAPHAGHIYSGPVAGYAFAAVQGNQYDTVVVISPYHAGHPEPILTTSCGGYATPLGEIPVDIKNLAKLKDHLVRLGGPAVNAVSNDHEHAIEIELPFLQIALKENFKLLPLMLASMSLSETEVLGTALAETLRGQNIVLVASSDLSHFYPETAANQLDQAILDAVASFEPDQVRAVHYQGKGQACGLAGILTVMRAAKELGADSARILKYATSGDVSGDYQRVVGYGAAVFTRS
jgi:MEMO1 family protein